MVRDLLSPIHSSLTPASNRKKVYKCSFIFAAIGCVKVNITAKEVLGKDWTT